MANAGLLGCRLCTKSLLLRRRPVCPPPLSRWYSSSESSLPRIASPSLWASMVPKPLRGSGKGLLSRAKGFFTGEWNPATYFIVMSLLVGSNAIQMVSLKTRRLNYDRSVEAKLSLLREVIGKVQKGEDVDVEAMLGTGDPEREKEWEEVMKALEKDIDIWEKKGSKASEAQAEAGKDTSSAQTTQSSEQPEQSGDNRKPGFY